MKQISAVPGLILRNPLASALCGVLLLSWVAFGQATTDKPAPAFEVADIKPSDPNNPLDGKARILAGGRIEVAGMTVKSLILFSYGVQEDMVAGLPAWADARHFDIVAKAPPETPPATLRLMMQTLLADRFKLAIRHEDKVRQAYVLTIAKGGPKLQQPSGGQQRCAWVSVDAGLRRRECHNLSMAELAQALPGWAGAGIDFPVVDETGLKGTWDFQFELGLPGTGNNSLPLADSGPTILTALESIGLKLEVRKIPLSVIAVEHVEVPSDQ